MKTFSKNFRTAIVALSTVGLMLPQTVLAGGHPSGMSGASSHVASHPVTSALNHNPTITSSSGLIAKTATPTNLNSSVTTSSGQPGGHPHFHGDNSGNSTSSNSPTTVIKANAANLSKAPLTSLGQSNAPSMQIKDSEGSIPVASIALGGLNATATFLTDGDSGATDPASPKGNIANPASSELTNGSGGGLQDGGVMGTYQMNSDGSAGAPVNPTQSPTPATPAKPIPAVAYGKISNQSEKSGQVAIPKKNPNDFATAQNASEGNVVKYGDGKSNGPSTPTPPPTPKPSNSNPMPFPFPSGSVFDGDSNNSSTSTTDSTTASTTTPATTTPAATDSTTTPAATPAAASSIDLVLEDVTLAAPATLVAGPAYTVKFRNQGTVDAGKFQVGIFAGFTGKLTSDAPRATVEVPSLAAGEVKEVTLRLPQKAMKLTGVDGKPTAFTRLFIGVDLNNTVIETDKTNNTAVVDRAALEATAAN